MIKVQIKMGNDNSRSNSALSRTLSTNSAMSASRGVAEIHNAMDNRAKKSKNRKLEKQLKEDFKNDSKYIKLLVLGAGESGKSTIIKQMKLIHPNVDGREEEGFTIEERIAARKAVYINIVDAIANLLYAIEDLNIDGWQTVIYSGNDMKTKNEALGIIDAYDNTLHTHVPKKGDDKIFDSTLCPPPGFLKAVQALWESDIVQKAYLRRNEFQLADSTAYFMQHLERICAADYQPEDQDVLRTRVKTTGVSKIEFTFKKVQFRMFDVGGQRSERKKWIHCFDNVTAILFVVSIAEYDQSLEEDKNVNRMHESMELFENIVNNQYFKRKSFIVFFNKKDLFEIKIREKPIKQYFPNYQGDDQSFTESSEFLVKEYLSKDYKESSERSLYPHLTTATDTEHVKFVFVTVADIILTQCLGDLLLS